MLLSKDTNPKNDVFYIGSQILSLMEAQPDAHEYELLELYLEYKSVNKLSLNLFSLAVTWLFLLGTVSLSEKGNIVKCF